MVRITSTRRLAFAFVLLCLVIISCSRKSNYTSVSRPYLVVLSIDGCRWDYPDVHDMKVLKSIGETGVRAEAIIPAYPSKTFPNHYTMATGLYPDKHGIVSNNFYDPETELYFTIGNRDRVEDPRFWGGEAIWTTAEKQDVNTASFFWVGTETSDSSHPSIRKYFDSDVPFETRVDSAFSWLYLPESKRPHLIMFYFEEPDGAGHRFGPEADETGLVLKRVDSLIGVSLQEIEKAEQELGIEINFIVTSDHGMGYIPPENNIFLEDYIDLEDLSAYAGSNPAYMLQPDEGKYDEMEQSLSTVPHIKVWHKTKVPGHYHYGTNDRIFDLIVEADKGWGVRLRRSNSSYSYGTHGYDPDNNDMHAIFYATGPAFKSGYVHPKFENINLYPLIAGILELEPSEVDGKLENVKAMLKD